MPISTPLNHNIYCFTYSTMFICSSSISYYIISIKIHRCITNNKKHIHTMHSTPIFMWKPNVGENHEMIFLYVKNFIQGRTKFLCFLAATGRRLQPPSFLGYNPRESPTPQFSGYNQKEDTTPYVLRLQLEGGYNHLSLPRPTALTYK